MTRLLIHDLRQVATPSGRGAPLRGPELDNVDVLEDAYVLVEDGAISDVGQMRELGPLGDDVDELDEAKSGYGLDRETELASLRAIRGAGGVPTWLGAHAVPPEFDDADPYLDFALAEVLPEAARVAEAADVFLERGAFDAKQARRYLEACRAAGLVLRMHGDQFTEAGAIPLALELGVRSVDHLEATSEAGIRTLAGSGVSAVLLPASALFLGRPMPPARAFVAAGAAVALATDFNPGSAFTESLPLVCSLACTQLMLTPSEALAACTVNAAHVLGRADRKGRIAPGYDADLLLLDVPDWRYLAYHLGGDLGIDPIVGGRRALP